MAEPTLEELERLAYATGDTKTLALIKVALRERDDAYEAGVEAGRREAEEDRALFDSN